jgi:hypothetical protein
MNAVHAELNRYAVPNPTIQWENLTDCGQFDFRAWQVKLSNTKWDRNPLNVTAQEQIDFKKHIAELADTVYHECRHCEQWFRTARFLAAKRTGGSRKYSKTDISAMTGIPEATARSAKNAPGLKPEAMEEGRVWYEGVYGQADAPQGGAGVATPVVGINRRELVLGAASLRPTAQGPVAGKSEKSNVQADELDTISNNRQMTQYLQYRTLLPEEKDAHEVGMAVQTLFYHLAGLKGAPTEPKHSGVRQFASANVGTV